MRPLARPLLLLLSLTLLAGCGDGGAGKDKRPKAAHRVETLQASAESLAIQRERTGSLKIRREVRIHSQEEGQIKDLPYFEGDRVEQGALIAALEDQLLRAELQKAAANHHQAQQNLDRMARLAEKQLTSDDELSRAHTALEVAEAEVNLLQTRLDHTRITAPFSGIISARLVQPGDVTAKHGHLLTLIDPDSMIAEVEVSELLIPHLKIGDTVSVRIDALDRHQFNGKILRLHPSLDPASRQGRVEIAFEQIPPQSMAGQMARITFTIPARPRLLVPFTALQRDRDGEFLYLTRKEAEEEKAVRSPVVSGDRIGERVEILQGLQAGDSVITRGFMGLRDGKPVSDLSQGAPGGP